jgi:drug/metabolite transporter (DMT)-like permease
MDRTSGPSRQVLFIALTLSVLSISSAAAMIRLADAPALVVASARMMIAAAVLWVFAPVTGACRLSSINWKTVWWAGFFLALHFGFWITSLDSTSVASSLVLVTMNPVFVAVGSTFFLREPPSKHLLVGTFLSIIGCFILVIGESVIITHSLKGNLLAIGGAFAMSFYMMIGRYSSSAHNRSSGVLAYLTWVSTIAGILLVLAALVSGAPFTGYSCRSVLFMVLIALIPQSIGHSLINWSLKYLHTSYLAAAILVEPLAGTLIAYLVIGEKFSAYSLSGGLFILFGVGIAFRKTSVSRS